MDGPRTDRTADRASDRTSASASARDAAYLEAAFRHDLCTRDDRALRKLGRALAKPAAGAVH